MMLRATVLLSASIAAFLASCPAKARESAVERRAQRAPHSHAARRDAAQVLDELGATEPFDDTPRGKYLVATIRDGGGLAVWNTTRHKRLVRLDDSDRAYSMVTISDEARWVAGVRVDDHNQI